MLVSRLLIWNELEMLNFCNKKKLYQLWFGSYIGNVLINLLFLYEEHLSLEPLFYYEQLIKYFYFTNALKCPQTLTKSTPIHKTLEHNLSNAYFHSNILS